MRSSMRLKLPPEAIASRDGRTSAPSALRPKQIREPSLRLLRPALMWAELEHCRKRADWDETSFFLLLCTSRKSISFETVQASLSTRSAEFANLVGHVGMLDRKRLGLIIRDVRVEQLCDIFDSVRNSLDRNRFEFKVLTYPMAVVDEELVPKRSVRVGTLTSESMQSLFCLPTPYGIRALDIVVSAIGLLCLFPILLMAAILIVCTTSGPMFFMQRRTGSGGIPFNIYKFRTMVVDAEQQQSKLRHLNEQDGPAFKMVADPRVTAIGHILRFTCIDELPQLWNVLRGEMSLVGPRPLPCNEADACRWWQRRRLDVTPGITCTWQARGRSMLSFDEWMRMDLDYVRRRSLGFNFSILLETLAFLIWRRS